MLAMYFNTLILPFFENNIAIIFFLDVKRKLVPCKAYTEN